VATAEREASAAERIVRTLAVQPLPTPLPLAPSPGEPTVPRLRTDLVADDLANLNPRVRALRAEVERQRALLGVARASRAPNLDVSVFRSDEIDKSSTGASVGLRIPLWNANRGDIARASAATTVAGAEAERLRLEIATDLEGRLRDLQIAADQVTLLQGDLLAAAQRSVDLARFSYEEGETSLLDLLDAQRTFRDTQRELADARLALSLALADAQRLAGPAFMPWK
jgi:cobalt-zinc-cadmium efflux system outer membrane protein